MPTFVTTANGTAGAATSYTSTTRWNYISVANTGTTGVLWVRTDGQAAAAADGSYSVGPGQELVFANDLPYWSQAFANIPVGTITGAVGSATPAEMNPLGSSLAGGLANPGTSVSIFSAGTPTFTISAAG